jgi:hypothetical protein
MIVLPFRCYLIRNTNRYLAHEQKYVSATYSDRGDPGTIVLSHCYLKKKYQKKSCERDIQKVTFPYPSPIFSLPKHE